MSQRLELPEDFDPAITFKSGQTFRWFVGDVGGSDWLGIVSGRVIRIRKSMMTFINPEAGNESENFLNTYFSLDDNLDYISSTFPESSYLQLALRQYRGLRILTQDPWECLISFVCSINKNIPAISHCIELLCRRFGNKILTDLDYDFFAFPTAKRLSKASQRELMECGVGFRWRYIKFISEKAASGEFELKRTSRMDYAAARSYLISNLSKLTMGVGPKVCDCSLLFSFHKLDAFPIDVWMLRCISKNYSQALGFDNQFRNGISSKTYAVISDKARSYFGEYAGYAQQYLYMKTRTDAIQKRARV